MQLGRKDYFINVAGLTFFWLLPTAIALSLGQASGGYVMDGFFHVGGFKSPFFWFLLYFIPLFFSAWPPPQTNSPDKDLDFARFGKFMKKFLMCWAILFGLFAILNATSLFITGMGHGGGLFSLVFSVSSFILSAFLLTAAFTAPAVFPPIGRWIDRLLSFGLAAENSLESDLRRCAMAGWVLPPILCYFSLLRIGVSFASRDLAVFCTLCAFMAVLFLSRILTRLVSNQCAHGYGLYISSAVMLALSLTLIYIHAERTHAIAALAAASITLLMTGAIVRRMR